MAGIFNSVLITSFWGGCLTVLFLLVNKLFKKKLPVSWHYYIWLIVMIRLLVPAFITVSVEPKEAAIVSQAKNILQMETPANTIPTIDSYGEMTVTQTSDIQTDDQIISPSVKDTAANIVNQVFQANNLWILWLSIAAILIGYKFSSYFLYARKLKASFILPSEYEINIFSKQKESLNMRGNIAFFKNKQTQTPFAMGLFNLMAILPDKEYSDTQLNYIFHHELTHINRHDIAVKWLYEIVKAVHWFNPFVYVASRNASFYCEASCDAKVLKDRTTNERKEYGMTILDLISQAVNPKTPMCISMHSNRSNLKKRIQYMGV